MLPDPEVVRRWIALVVGLIDAGRQISEEIVAIGRRMAAGEDVPMSEMDRLQGEGHAIVDEWNRPAGAADGTAAGTGAEGSTTDEPEPAA